MAGKIFFAQYNAEFRLGADAAQPEVRYNDGKLKTAAAEIKFNNHVWRVPDDPLGPKLEGVLRNSTEFKNGRIREITTEQYTKLMADQAQKIGVVPGMIKPNTGDDVGYKMPEDKHEIKATA